MFGWIAAYLLAVNAVAFGMMYVDKQRAKKKKWRISEHSLFTAALLGGSIGSIAGMRLFRHKTKHWYFVWGMPLILAAQLLLCLLLCWKIRSI